MRIIGCRDCVIRLVLSPMAKSAWRGVYGVNEPDLALVMKCSPFGGIGYGLLKKRLYLSLGAL